MKQIIKILPSRYTVASSPDLPHLCGKSYLVYFFACAGKEARYTDWCQHLRM